MADKYSWIDTYGREYQLTSDNGIKVMSGVAGRFMPPIEHVEEEVPFQPGSRRRNTKVKKRPVDIPLKVTAESETALRQKVRDCLSIFNPLIGEGRIKITAADGSQRELFCRYSTGLEGKEDRSIRGLVMQNIILVFWAFDPYWYDIATNIQTFKLNENPGLFFPLPPLRLATSTVFADTTINNSGDAEAWPEWIITGPCDSVNIKNITTGEILNLNQTDAKLSAGESITINTNPNPPNEKTIIKNDGTNLFYTTSEDSSLWDLQPGNNTLQILMENTTTDSQIQLSYRNRYLGA